MKKTKLTRSLLAACSIVALSAVMYGCVHGGGGGGPVATDVTLSGAQMGQTLEAGTYQPDDALTAAIEGASEAALEAAAGEHATGDMITVAGLDFSCVSGPCSVTVNDNGTVTTMGTIKVMEQMVAVVPVVPVVPEPVDPAIEQRADISAAIGMANAALATLKDDTSDATAAETAAVKTAIANAKTAIADGTAVPPTELAANTIAVSAIENDFSTVYAAISKTNTATSLADAKALLPALRLSELAEPHETGTPGYPTATLSASSAGKFEVTTDTPDFTMGDAPDMIAGWRGTTLEHTNETLVVYSNIEDGEAKPVGATYESVLDSNTFDVVDSATDNEIPWSAVKSDLVTTFDPDEGDEGTTTFMGSVKGAMGTFTCLVATCPDPTKNDEGEIQNGLAQV